MELTIIDKKELFNFLKLKSKDAITIEPKSFIFGDVYSFTLMLECKNSKESISLATQVFKADKNKKLSFYEDEFVKNCSEITRKVYSYYEC